MVPMRCCAYPGLPAKSCLKEAKAFKGPNQTHFRIDGLFTLKKELLPKNLLLKKVLGRTICELTDKTPSLTLGKVTVAQKSLKRLLVGPDRPTDNVSY